MERANLLGRWVGLEILFAACGFAACNGADTPDAPTWNQDVKPIVESNCLGCHDEGGQSGIVLTSYADASPWREAIGLAVEERRMPPWLAGDDCASYSDDLSLSEEERGIVHDWVAAGGPEGDEEDAAPTVSPVAAGSLERVNLTLQMPVSYTPVSTPDDYRCFLLEWPETEQAWVTGYDVVPGNLAEVHHVIAFLINPADRETFQALDAAAEGEGYPCYGGPGGDVSTLIRTQWLGSWAPGGGAGRTPSGTGIEIAPGTLVAMQVHYNITSTDPAPDQTAIALTVEHEPMGWASVQPWTDPRWILGTGMNIPARSEGIAHEFTYTLSESDGFSIHATALHMHTLGQHARMEVRHTDGTTSCLLDIPRWDFNWQREYSLTEPVVARPGDQVKLSCVWDNPTDSDIAWGEGTGDEMCLGLTLLSD